MTTKQETIKKIENGGYMTLEPNGNQFRVFRGEGSGLGVKIQRRTGLSIIETMGLVVQPKSFDWESDRWGK